MEATQQPSSSPAPPWSRLPLPLWPHIALHLDRPGLQSLLLSCRAPHAALHHNTPFTADWLVAEGARGALSCSPLLTAVHHGLVEVVAHMMRRGQGPADRSATADVLRAAARSDHVQLIELLLNSTPCVRPADITGGAGQAHPGDPVAAWLSKQEAVECCMEAAAINGQLAVCETLLRDHGADAQSQYLLRFAAKEGHEAVCRLLLQHGAQAHEALQGAVFRGQAHVVALLLQHGADVNAHSGYALRFAATNGQDAMVSLLLQHSQPHADNVGMALFGAALSGHAAVVSVLLNHGTQHSSALFAAARNGHAEVVSLLLQRSQVARDARDHTLCLLEGKGTDEVCRLLMQHDL